MPFRFSPDAERSAGPSSYDVTFSVSDGLTSDSETITVTVNEDASPTRPAGERRHPGPLRPGAQQRQRRGPPEWRAGVRPADRPLAGFPLTVTGSGDDDTLTVDFSGGDPIRRSLPTPAIPSILENDELV
jgi:hypothetical protein